MIHPGCEQNFKFPFGILYVAISRDDTVIEIDIQYSTLTLFMICFSSFYHQEQEVMIHPGGRVLRVPVRCFICS